MLQSPVTIPLSEKFARICQTKSVSTGWQDSLFVDPVPFETARMIWDLVRVMCSKMFDMFKIDNEVDAGLKGSGTKIGDITYGTC